MRVRTDPKPPTIRSCCGTATGQREHYRHDELVCDACKVWHRMWQRGYRKRRYLRGPQLLPALGAQRRIQALAWEGWSAKSLGPHLLMSERAVQNILTRGQVKVETADRVDRVYRRLVGIPGPSAITARRARVNGWVPWIDWDDIDDPREVPWRLSVECALERAVAAAWDAACAEGRQRRYNEGRRARRTDPEFAARRSRVNRRNYERRKARSGERAA